MVQNLGNPNLQQVEIGTVWNEWQDNVDRSDQLKVQEEILVAKLENNNLAFGRRQEELLQRQEITTVQQVQSN